MHNKKQLRIWAKEIRKILDIQAISQQLVIELKNTQEYKQAKKIMIFYPLKDEINILPLLKDKTKTFYLPKIDGRNLLCCCYHEGEELCESCFKTKEPISETIGIPDLAIVPALAADKQNYRLGYGGGFYDRFLAKTNCKKIVCLPEQLVVESIYPDKYDVPVDKVICV